MQQGDDVGCLTASAPAALQCAAPLTAGVQHSLVWESWGSAAGCMVDMRMGRRPGRPPAAWRLCRRARAAAAGVAGAAGAAARAQRAGRVGHGARARRQRRPQLARRARRQGRRLGARAPGWRLGAAPGAVHGAGRPPWPHGQRQWRAGRRARQRRPRQLSGEAGRPAARRRYGDVRPSARAGGRRVGHHARVDVRFCGGEPPLHLESPLSQRPGRERVLASLHSWSHVCEGLMPQLA
jgi:hypothetical protein